MKDIKTGKQKNHFTAILAVFLIVCLCVTAGCGVKKTNKTYNTTEASMADTSASTKAASESSAAFTDDTDAASTSAPVTQTEPTYVSDTTGQVSETTTTEAPKPEYLKGLKIGCDYFIGYDKTNDTVLFEKNADARCYPASVTKILTAIVAMENVPLDARIKVGSECNMVPEGSSSAEIKPGQSFRLEDILYGMLLPSGNDAANTIAVNTARYLYGESLGISDAISKFMQLCNDKLAEIGTTGTHFASPYGWSRSDHYTTVRDILKISIYAMENPDFAKIVKTVSKTVTALSGETFKWKNTNYLLKETDSRYYEYTTGIKNGYSEKALYCLSASACKDGRELFAVAFHAERSTTRYADAKRFFETAYSAFPAEQPEEPSATERPETAGQTELTGTTEQSE